MDKTERAVTKDARIELREHSGKRTLFGYAAVYNSLSEDLGGFREIIRAGAFDNALATPGLDVSARIQHEGGMSTMGRTTNETLRLGSDERGLWYEATPPDTQMGRDLLRMVEDGYLDKSSFAFSVRDAGELWHFDQEPALRELFDVDLYDVAPVDGPAYKDTTVQARELGASILAEARSKVADVVANISINGTVDNTDGIVMDLGDTPVNRDERQRIEIDRILRNVKL